MQDEACRGWHKPLCICEGCAFLFADYFVPFRLQIETKKLELETNLSTNLLRRQQELEAIISSAENDMLAAEAESKQKDVDEAKSLVEEATEELRSESRVIFFVSILLV